jgi:capsular polysaccharide transport system permease protein
LLLSEEATPLRHQLSAAIRMHVRIVAALVRREMKAHFGASRIGYLWALIEPALHLATYLMIFIFVFRRHAPVGTSIALFVLTGFVPYFLYSKLANYVSASIGSNRSLLTLPPVKPLDVVAARVVLESATYLFVGSLMFLGLYLSGIPDAAPYDPLKVMEACAVAICLGLGIGMINIVILSYFHNWMTFFGMISTPLWFFSGIWFLPEQVPEPYRGYMLYNPLLHVILMFRTAFYGDYASTFLDAPYVITVDLLLLATGLALMQVARRKVLEPS